MGEGEEEGASVARESATCLEVKIEHKAEACLLYITEEICIDDEVRLLSC